MKEDEEAPKEPEVLNGEGPEAPRAGGLQRIEQGTPVGSINPISRALSGLVQSPKREARKAREWADNAHAHTELDEALVNLGISRRKLQQLPKILAADDRQRDLELARLDNQVAEEQRIAENRELADKISRQELLAKLAAAELRTKQAREALARAGRETSADETERIEREVERQFRAGMGQQITEHAIRRRAQQLTDEITGRAGGKITPSVQRELDNVIDTMNKLLNKL